MSIEKDKYRIAEPNEELEAEILGIFSANGRSDYSLAEVIRGLDRGKETRPRDIEIRRALWRLIDHGHLKILANRKLLLTRNGDEE